jgi:hypothetical protein
MACHSERREGSAVAFQNLQTADSSTPFVAKDAANFAQDGSLLL